jgi:adenosylmethionine-8-amino-7-oxononanoate transaminase
MPKSSPVALDKKFVWHPFTPADSWLDPGFEPLVIQSGQGASLTDTQGRTYLDGNSSIWTNLHGHRHPQITDAVKEQLDQVAHVSFLGLTHEPAARLAEKLSDLFPSSRRIFYSDDGSTAMEAALKMIWQYFQQNGQPNRKIFVSLDQGYHGDTVGAMSLGHSQSFHETFSPLLFASEKVPSPGCYRCPFNRARPQKADARTYAQCNRECIGQMKRALEKNAGSTAAVVLEPLVQGAAGMVMHPPGYLKETAALAKTEGAFLLLDEVMTGFGRTGAMFAHQKEDVSPDVVALAKGLTGGYLPLAATVVREDIFDGFRGGLDRTFFHGHSYTANALGCAAALANLEIFEQEQTLRKIQHLAGKLHSLSQKFWNHPHVGDVRQEGLILAVELVEDFGTRKPFPAARRLAWQISENARAYGLLTRGIGNVLVLMPPYCVSESELAAMIDALYRSLSEILPFS